MWKAPSSLVNNLHNLEQPLNFQRLPFQKMNIKVLLGIILFALNIIWINDLLMREILSEVWGILSATISMNTVIVSKTERPSVIFSPLSGGSNSKKLKKRLTNQIKVNKTKWFLNKIINVVKYSCSKWWNLKQRNAIIWFSYTLGNLY
jgi:hypothetical protein